MPKKKKLEDMTIPEYLDMCREAGHRGGTAAAANMTPEARSERAKAAATVSRQRRMEFEKKQLLLATQKLAPNEGIILERSRRMAVAAARKIADEQPARFAIIEAPRSQKSWGRPTTRKDLVLLYKGEGEADASKAAQ